jgi:hypothetical protein
MPKYYEPWTPTRSQSWEPMFKLGPPKYPDAPSEEDWLLEIEALKKNAAWLIWGSGMQEPPVCVNLDGTVCVGDDRGIIAVSKLKWLPEKSVSQEGIARRVCECVNAMAGVRNPEAFMNQLRKFLMELSTIDSEIAVQSECDVMQGLKSVSGDATSLLSMCIPPTELDKKEVEF